MNNVRRSSSRVDVNEKNDTSQKVECKKVYKELSALDPKWMHCTLEELLRKYWEEYREERKTVRWGTEWKIDNPIRNMPVVSKRSSYIIFNVYSLQSPDRDLQLAIALVKSICKDYDKLADITGAGEYACPTQICENDFCTIIAKDILSQLYN